MREHTCATCGTVFSRYAISAKRAAKPQYCSLPCKVETERRRAEERFTKRLWSRVKIAGPNDCWEWQGRHDPNGYGRLDVDGVPGLVHRFIFKATNRFSPVVVRHFCDNPPCCNPAHLLAGTQLDNVADMIERGRRVAPRVRRRHLINASQ